MSWIFLLLTAASLAYVQATWFSWISTCNSCAANTHCVNNKCLCLAGHLGNPYFHCYHNNNAYCSITYDPVVRTFGGERLSVNGLLSSYVAEVRTNRVALWSGHCNLALWAMTERVKGKSYINEVQLRLTQTDALKNQHFYELRILTSALNGKFSWSVEYRLQDRGSFVHLHTFKNELLSIRFKIILINSCTIKFTLMDSHILKVEIICCGILFGIRPFNPAEPKVIPGIFLEVTKTHQPTFDRWSNTQQPLCLDTDGYAARNISMETGITNQKKAMTLLGLMNGGPLDFFGAAKNLLQLTTSLKRCSFSILNKLSVSIWWSIFNHPPLKSCVCGSRSGWDGYVDFLLLVLDWCCHGVSSSCRSAQNVLKERCAGEMRHDSGIRRLFEADCSKVW
ncbi:uncharacterized protein LOC131954888 [Physella acuta]|uniref:uncharacterized protein LOC131954888 n=1 Tax=Physella acuta TaxID=109671 RepID=UPI0027DDEA4A|nr:uncharacterized protein LOC131954888 [Physella acuta]XP_059174691.1 uncharacterized protein LOC131954888 [Physella acuta]